MISHDISLQREREYESHGMLTQELKPTASVSPACLLNVVSTWFDNALLSICLSLALYSFNLAQLFETENMAVIGHSPK